MNSTEASALESPYKLPSIPVQPQAQQAFDYWVDAWQRSVLFLDVLRQRGNTHFEQSKKEAPNVLHFDFEIISDGRQFARPVNYMLMRILPQTDSPAPHPRKRPFIVFDPRGGHGAGIGGMKQSSEIGSALEAGHPCYFVGFFPEPMPDQSIEDVCQAEATFIATVIARHPDAEGKPCLIGNCQAGWQLMMTCSIRPELAGPIILAGAPLSYWGGVHKKAPMRYSGGILGGSWLTSLTSDLGAGVFDGASLVQNFENLNPANTYWTKNYNLYSKIDTEAARFLEFEKWWGNPIFLSGKEMQFIVDNLFIGNKLTSGEIHTENGLRIDLRNIHTPIIVFCSHGDEITPPQQALGWVLDLYDTDEEIIASGQTIIYSLHANIGHLGIFVSGAVAAKQYREFSQNIDFIDTLPPGLYEATFQPKDESTLRADLLPTDYVMSFHPRKLDDLRALGGNDAEDERCFATVAKISEINQGLYRTLLQPAVRALSNEQMAKELRRLNALRLRFEIFSDKNPFLAPLASLAETVRQNRKPASPDTPYLALQEKMSEQIIHFLDGYRDLRDSLIENVFFKTYSSPFVQALAGLKSENAEARRKIGRDVDYQRWISDSFTQLRTLYNEGNEDEAFIRALIYLIPFADERSFALMRQLHEKHPSKTKRTLEEFKALVRQQFLLVHMNAEQAINAIPELLKYGTTDKAAFLDVLNQVASTAGELPPDAAQRFQRIKELLS